MHTRALIYPYKLPTKREGLILKIWKENGEFGYGDIAPLPNWSKETLKQAKDELLHLIDKDFSYIPSYPSVAFGVSAALYQPFDPLNVPSFTSSYLLSGSQQNMFDKLQKIPSGSFAKVKLGSFSPSQAIELVLEILQTKPLLLSLDINRKWSVQEALVFCQAFSPNHFRYIEEPVKTIEQLRELFEKTGHSFALDEHLRELSLHELLDLSFVKAWIIKPTLQGSIETCLQYASAAHKIGIAAYLSSSYESPVGIHHIIRLAQNHFFQQPLGIDTYDLPN